jgi:NAD(P)-dependent dehydrogenase (short-subunit alcohol dehydrogenase family)
VLVNNAGIDQPPDSPGGRHHLQTLPVDDFRRMVEVNLIGTFQVTQVFGDRMARSGGGSIINIGSLYASVSPDPHFYDHLAGNAPFIKAPAYGASKAGVVNLSKFFATHWAGAGIRVNTLSPGGVQSEVWRPGTDGTDGRAAGSQGPTGVSGLGRLVICDRPRAPCRGRLHGLVATPL